MLFKNFIKLRTGNRLNACISLCYVALEFMNADPLQILWIWHLPFFCAGESIYSCNWRPCAAESLQCKAHFAELEAALHFSRIARHLFATSFSVNYRWLINAKPNLDAMIDLTSGLLTPWHCAKFSTKASRQGCSLSSWPCHCAPEGSLRVDPLSLSPCLWLFRATFDRTKFSRSLGNLLLETLFLIR